MILTADHRQWLGDLKTPFRIQKAASKRKSGERDTQRIGHQLDHMLGFCCDPHMLLAFKRLCRYYYGVDPLATAGYVHAYREMWDTPGEDVAASVAGSVDSAEAGSVRLPPEKGV